MAVNPPVTNRGVTQQGAAGVPAGSTESAPVAVDRNGRRATLLPVPSSMTGMSDGVDDASRVLLQFDNGEQLLVPRDLLVEETSQGAGQASGRIYRLRQSVEELRQSMQAVQDGQTLVIPVVEEHVSVDRVATTGRVQITKSVHEHVQVVDEPLLHEEVEIERVVINRPLANNARAAAEPRYEGNVLIIPLVEEVLVVEKRLIVKEEVRVRKVRREMHQPQEVTLRREEIAVTRTPGTED